ncbi:MAG: outer membrane lipoprotein-sorting protein [Mariprofundaceae bacterium]|nr:outer membrane lipoprotein-sorting protein [Mariprofundaceae bacterium]
MKTLHIIPKEVLSIGLFILGLAMLTPTLSLAANAAEQRGLDIASEADQRDFGFGDYRVHLEMTLRNKHQQQTSRSMRNTTREQADDGEKTLIIFDNPRDVKGTAFLSHTHKAGADDQWLFLPALKRVKRISSSNKAGPFMGSEFAYEDISSQEVEKYTYNFRGEESFDARNHFVVERFPTNAKSGYHKQVVWYDQAEYRIWKIDFYDRRDELFKTLTYSDYNQYLNKYWRANQMDMINHKTGKSTTLTFSAYQFAIGTTDMDFTASRLKRAR